MNMQDALFNWLQMRIVSDSRPDDRAALDTLDFFATILREDHKLDKVEIASRDEERITLKFEQDGSVQTRTYDRELSEKLLSDINSNPKYNE